VAFKRGPVRGDESPEVNLQRALSAVKDSDSGKGQLRPVANMHHALPEIKTSSESSSNNSLGADNDELFADCVNSGAKVDAAIGRLCQYVKQARNVADSKARPTPARA
jgi:hypothetical protein